MTKQMIDNWKPHNAEDAQEVITRANSIYRKPESDVIEPDKQAEELPEAKPNDNAVIVVDVGDGLLDVDMHSED